MEHTRLARMAIQCAADDMETLRGCDIQRVLETAKRNGSYTEVVAWIQNDRPDLTKKLNEEIN